MTQKIIKTYEEAWQQKRWGHVEIIANTINMLLEGASKDSDPNDLPLSVALESPNIHHFLVAGQSCRPVDAAGNPWSASYIYDSGNLVLKYDLQSYA